MGWSALSLSSSHPPPRQQLSELIAICSSVPRRGEGRDPDAALCLARVLSPPGRVLSLPGLPATRPSRVLSLPGGASEGSTRSIACVPTVYVLLAFFGWVDRVGWIVFDFLGWILSVVIDRVHVAGWILMAIVGGPDLNEHLPRRAPDGAPPEKGSKGDVNLRSWPLPVE